MDVVDSDAEVEEEDPNIKNDDFKGWLQWTTAHVRYLHCLLKLADRIDTSSNGNDQEDDFEDMSDDDQLPSTQVVDIDEIKFQCLALINLPQILELTQPIP